MKKFLAILACLVITAIAIAGPQTTSSTTGTNMIARARYYLDEPTALKWTEAELLQYLNDGMVDIVAKTHCYQTIESVSLSASTVEYTPSTDFISIIAAVYNPNSGDAIGLVKGNMSSLGRASDADVPAYWYEFDGKIGVYPPPDSDCTTDTDCSTGSCTNGLCHDGTTNTVDFYMTMFPDAIATSESVTIPAIFDKALVYYITSQAFLKDKRVNEANNFLYLYQAELDRYRSDFMRVDNETTEPIR